MAALTQVEIDELIGKLKKFPYLASAGSTELGPLNGAPQIEGDVELKDVVLYETGADVQASYLSKNNVKVTLKTRDVEGAMTLLGAFAKGDNIYAADKKKELTLVPITASGSEKTITFPNAFLQPGLSFAPGANEDPSEATLVYICKPDAIGKPFKYGTGA